MFKKNKNINKVSNSQQLRNVNTYYEILKQLYSYHK
jgi:hypothetical protein